MPMSVYNVLDWFFMTLHPAIILFNLAGWMLKKTRKANLVLLLFTGSSWFILGLWKGIGYCPLTDWHFTVLEKAGAENLPDSYIKYLIHRITGWNVTENTADILTVTLYFIALVCSLFVNIRSRMKMKKNKKQKKYKNEKENRNLD